MKELYATIDLGSNSFHMLIAALEFDEIKIIDSISDKVMLADGLCKENGIAPDAKERGISCIKRFVQRLADIPRENIRIVGTNTLRAAVNSDDFVNHLERLLGDIPIEIISGIEEARLIFLGVSHTWSSIRPQARKLVIDIGGGSTEFIIGKTFDLKQAESLRMGCVAFRRFFPANKISQAYFDDAERIAVVELGNILSDFKPKYWSNVIGSAGTFKAIEQLSIAQGFTEEGITYSALLQLKQLLLSFDNMADLELEGLKELRKKTILPGVAIAVAIFRRLKIDSMQISRGGLREGILYDLIGRHREEDIRERSIAAISKRYGQHSKRIKLNRSVVTSLLDQLDPKQTIEVSQQNRRYLLWAASCSQIGLSISHSQHQNHSAYLIQNSELHGFTLKERAILATIVKNHRRKIKLSALKQLGLDTASVMSLIPVICILRLCFIITQNSRKNKCKEISLSVSSQKLVVNASQQWIDEHPLIVDSISQESKYWANVKVDFSIDTLD
jgi:exopolyphosphatase/guanosine-5'-triphosphate,3'-diphosphate pyrophosphatase